MIFWNVAGIRKKDKEFWDYVKEFDCIGLVETWMEEKEWETWKTRLPSSHRWKCQGATRTSNKGRARGGILTGIRNEVNEIDAQRTETTGTMLRVCKVGPETWKIWTIYCREGMEKLRKELEEQQKEEEEQLLIISGDLNARIGEKGSLKGEDEETASKRTSKDKKTDAEGEKLLKLTEDRGWHILNGNIKGDEGGEWTFIGERGSSVIDYAITNPEGLERIEELNVGERVESDHLPLIIKLKSKTTREEEKEKEIQKREIIIWNENSIKEYKDKTRGIRLTGESTDDKWEQLVDKVKESMKKKKIRTGQREIGHLEWWDRECSKAKRKVKNLYRKWKADKGTREEYTEERKRFKELCKLKETQKKEEEIQEISQMSTEQQIWKYLNKGRKRRKMISDKISIECWKTHFKDLLGGTEKQEPEGNETGQETEDEEQELTSEEIEKQIRKLKKKKAPGDDGIPNEAWRELEGEGKEQTKELIRSIWKGEGLPKSWRRGIIAPLHKKGNEDEASNYRGITLLNTGYKIYTAVLNERLKKDAEEKGIIPDVQAGFREKRGTMDNIYILQHVVERELEKKGGKVFGFFIDLKAAFDRVDRNKMWKTMEKRGIRKGLIRRAKEIYTETCNVVRANGTLSQEFWTKEGVRQGCPLSPTLFTIFTSDMEEELKKGQTGGIVVGREKFWSLAYADDVVLVATTEEELKSMIKRLEKYLENKKLTLNAEKSKIVAFRKGGGRTKKIGWKWRGQPLEEVKEFSYLGYTIKKNGSSERHIQELVKKANIAVKKVWSLGERKVKDDFETRLMLFDYLVVGILAYGAEIWGWQERENVERTQLKYLKWCLGLQRCTPDYIVLEETKREKLKIRLGLRAWNFETAIEKNENKKILNECLREKKRGRIRTTSCIIREQYMRRIGLNQEEINRARQDGTDVPKIARERERETQGQWQYDRIQRTRYNERYKHLRTEDRPEYLKSNGRKGSQKLIARARCGNLEEENWFWLPEEDRICKLRGRGRGSLQHLLRDCEHTRADDITIEEVVGEKENQEAIRWLRKLDKKRQEKKPEIPETIENDTERR